MRQFTFPKPFKTMKSTRKKKKLYGGDPASRHKSRKWDWKNGDMQPLVNYDNMQSGTKDICKHLKINEYSSKF